MRIVVDDLTGSRIVAFLGEHVQQMRAVTPAGSMHALTLDELRSPDVAFWSVRDGDTVVGCAALKRMTAEHAELKAMRTAPARQRGGVASRLLGHVLFEAGQAGFVRVSLETGVGGFFRPARKLYEKFGFEYCAPFGGYAEDVNSVYMTRRI